MKLALLTLASTSLSVIALGLACDRSSAAPVPPTPAAPGSGNAGNPTTSKIDSANYTLELKSVGEYKQGTESAVELLLVAKPGWHVNEEYPTKFKATEAEGVKWNAMVLAKTKEAGAFTFDKCAQGTDSCTMHVKAKFTPAKKGTIYVAGELYFGVCNKDSCVTDKQKVVLPITAS